MRKYRSDDAGSERYFLLPGKAALAEKKRALSGENESTRAFLKIAPKENTHVRLPVKNS